LEDSNDHIELSQEATEANAWAVLGWDFGAALMTTEGYLFIAAGNLTDPMAAEFGAILVNVASAATTVTLLDTAITSGPSSNAYTVSSTTYTAGWASAVLDWPLDLGAAWLQVAYDYYTIDYMYRHPTP
jgi:hypothetical protein